MKYQTLTSRVNEKKEIWSGTILANNERLVDDSGFVPLDIRMKKIDIATAQRKLALAQFDYRETEELYNDDIIFSSYDSIEELQEKMDLYNEKKKAILQQRFAEYSKQRAASEAKNVVKSAETPQSTEPKQTNSNNDTIN